MRSNLLLPLMTRWSTQDPDQPRSSLRQFLLAWIRVILISFVLLIILGVVFFVYRTEAQSWSDRQNEAVDSASHTINLFIQDNYETLITISHMDINLLKLFSQIMEENLRRSPSLLEIVRMDSNGEVLTSTFRDRAVIANFYTIQQSRWFQQARTGANYLSDVQFTADNDPYIILAVPTLNQGVAAARLEMKVLQEVVGNLHFGSTGQTYIIDSRGTIVAHSDPGITNRQVNMSDLAIFSTILATPDKHWHGTYENFLGQWVVGSSAAIPGTDWIVITEISRHESMSSTVQAVAILGSILLLAGAIMNLAATRLLQNAIFRPIQILHAGAEQIGLGNLEGHIQVIYNDEIGDVAQAFNQMTLRLMDREKALEQARDEALAASLFKSRLLANVGHDIRTPINSILGYADILNEGIYGSLSAQQQKAATRILSSTRRLLNLVNSILDESQIEVGKIVLSSQPCDPGDILRSIREALEIPTQAKGVLLETTCDPNLPLLMGDAQRLTQIVWNLAENGLKFTQQGQVSIAFSRVDADHWKIEVSDTGAGIPLEAQGYIFEAFRQVDGSTTRENRGIGLGLSIVKQLTLLMGGSVQLQSQVGQGSTFSVLLPLIPANGLLAANEQMRSNFEEKQE